MIAELEIRRVHYSKQSLRTNLGNLDDLVASIRENGLLQPIVVRPDGDTFQIIAGNRRLEACKRLGLRKITSTVVDLDDKEAYELSLVENVQRNDLDPIEEAEAFRKYVEEFGYGSITELARRIHKSQTYVTRRIQLLDVAPEIRNLVSSGQMTVAIAQEIVGLSFQDNRLLAETIVDNNLHRSHVREIVRQMREPKRDDYAGSNRQVLTREAKKQRLERIIAKCIASLKLSMSRASDVLDDAGDDFVLSEIIFNWRMELNQQIDILVKLKRKLKTLSSKEFDEIA